MAKKAAVKQKKEAEPSKSNSAAASKRGRPAKEPPPEKLWRVEAVSPEGLRVTLGRFVTREEAEPELNRLQSDGFYEKLEIIESPPEVQEASE